MNSWLGKKNDKSKIVQPITSFSGYYEFLSIDYPCNIYFQGFIYPSVTVAFQAARTNDISIRRKISEAKSQEEFKQIITGIKNTPNWNERRVNVMIKLNRDKFKRNKQIALKLFATQDRELINGYGGGGDAHCFWGMIQVGHKFQGLNTLGKVLTQLRTQMKDNTDVRKWLEDQNIEKDQSLWPQSNLIVQKEGDQVDNLLLTKKNSFIFGTHASADFKLQHGSISKFHAGIYFSSNMQLILVDLNSTHGTTILRNGEKIQLQALRPQSIENKDVICFGMSSRSYQQVDLRIARKEQIEREQLLKIQKLKQIQKKGFLDEEKSRQEVKALLQLKQYSCLYVQGVTRAFPYQTLKQIFNRYGPVKNIRISIDKKTGRYMGSALIYYQHGASINSVLENISSLGNLPLQFRTKAVFTQEAQNIIASFENKDHGRIKIAEDRKEKEELMARRKRKMQSRSRSRSRERRISRSSSSSSSSGISSSKTPEINRKDKKASYH